MTANLTLSSWRPEAKRKKVARLRSSDNVCAGCATPPGRRFEVRSDTLTQRVKVIGSALRLPPEGGIPQEVDAIALLNAAWSGCFLDRSGFGSAEPKRSCM